MLPPRPAVSLPGVPPAVLPPKGLPPEALPPVALPPVLLPPTTAPPPPAAPAPPAAPSPPVSSLHEAALRTISKHTQPPFVPNRGCSGRYSLLRKHFSMCWFTAHLTGSNERSSRSRTRGVPALLAPGPLRMPKSIDRSTASSPAPTTRDRSADESSAPAGSRSGAADEATGGTRDAVGQLVSASSIRSFPGAADARVPPPAARSQVLRRALRVRRSCGRANRAQPDMTPSSLI
jgi:hypothetical protein